MTTEPSTACCIVGGGPAGVLLSLLLARAGIRVTLLEMHEDFDRDFRGDTVHAATLELLDRLGLAERLHQLPHAKLRAVDLHAEGRTVRIASFDGLPSRYPYVMVMPQSAFLSFLAAEADQLPNFTRHMGAQVVGLQHQANRVVGVRYKQGGEEHSLRAELTVACDGRFSRLRKLADVDADGRAPPMDVAWFRLARHDDDPIEAGAFYVGRGRMLVLLSRVGEWQVGYIFPKGDFAAVKADGIESFRASVAALVPLFQNRVDAITDWSMVHLLSIKSDCLKHWYKEGLLFIGDAAHVMSPVFGVGINYAIADAVVAANVLREPLLQGHVPQSALAEVQRQREAPTRTIQRMQGFVQQRIIALALSGRPFSLPLPVRILRSIPWLRRIPARVVAFGFGRPHLDDAFVDGPAPGR